MKIEYGKYLEYDFKQNDRVKQFFSVKLRMFHFYLLKFGC